MLLICIVFFKDLTSFENETNNWMKKEEILNRFKKH